MDTISLIKRLHQHRAWADDRLQAAAAQLSNDKLHATYQIGQGSVWKSLAHMQGAEYVWLGALQGEEQVLFPGDLPGMIPGNQQGEGAIKDLAELRQKWTALEERWKLYLNGLDPASLDEMIYRTRSVGGTTTRFGCRRSDALLHVCTHAHYTGTQVVNMLRQCGVEKVPDIMLMSMARAEL
jgi:uncharacterized damage-inducible protein DinB